MSTPKRAGRTRAGRRRPARSLQARLALVYAACVYAAGASVLVFLSVPLATVSVSVPAGRPVPGTPAEAEVGIGLDRLVTGGAVALVLLIPVALALGWYVAGRFLSPLRAITATANVISAGDLHRRLDLGAPTDELTELGHTLDGLFARLQASFDAQRNFVANASHELRTPLAGQRTLLEVALADPEADADALRAACREALALGGSQERLVQALLTLATSERGVAQWDPADLAEVAKDVLATRRAAAARDGIGLTVRLAPAVTAGDPRLLESLVANLVDNAVRHNHAGGQVEITTRTSGTRAILTVANDGPVIPGDQVQRLLQPFQRLAPDRHGEGHGLGLAIVDAVARAHQATLTATARPEGGLAVTVEFGGSAL